MSREVQRISYKMLAKPPNRGKPLARATGETPYYYYYFLHSLLTLYLYLFFRVIFYRFNRSNRSKAVAGSCPITPCKPSASIMSKTYLTTRTILKYYTGYSPAPARILL